MPERERHGRALLKAVSRSFYLSLRILPRPMRAPLSLAYLLARTSDTLADTAAVPVAVRTRWLAEFARVVAGETPAGDFPKRLADEFVPHQSHAGEARLLAGVASQLDWLGVQPDDLRTAIREVLATIIAGQTWDLGFFAEGKMRVADAAALHRYTYQVAGCVGAFWTRIGFLTLGERFSRGALGELLELGVSYGCALQLVNILRDVEADRQLARCYLPVADPHDYGALRAARAGWAAVARRGLLDGLRYAEQLHLRRVRTATMLPALLGLETLDALAAASQAELAAGVKVTRRQVYRCFWDAWTSPAHGG